MADILESDDYLKRMLDAPRPGAEKFYAFYDHRVGAIGSDPRMLVLPLDDHLVHRGDGVFETCKYLSGRIYQLDPHIQRMQRSSAAIYLQPPCSWEELRELVIKTARAGGKEEGMIRILLGRGPGGFGIDPAECPTSSLHIVAYRISPKPEEKYEKGATAFKTSIPAKQSYMARIKSIDYLPNMLMKREAAQKGYDVALCFDEHGFLAEGSIENVCLVDQSGTLIVPEFTNALPGTTLLRALDLVKDDIPILFKAVAEGEIFEARELIAVGTTLDALSIVRYNGKPIHDVRPGPVSKRLRELLRQDLLDNGEPIFT